MARQDKWADEIAAVKQLVKKHPRPASVREVQIELGEDSTGDPAVWISLIVDEDLNPSRAKLEELNAFSDTITSEILKHDPRRFPYVRYRAAA